jgi:amino acid adenylation domain-containing protein/non-ribosomal peptide synthase protein (TIGR01720 family)
MFSTVIDLLDAARGNGVRISLKKDVLDVKVPRGRAIDPLLLSRIKEHKQLIIDYLRDSTWMSEKISAAEQAIVPVNRQDVERIPLSFAQERLWFIDKLHGSVQYHQSWIFRLSGSLNVSALEASFAGIVNRHEVLRTVINEEDGKGFQVVMPADTWRMQFVNISHIAGSIDEHISGAILQPFDLSADHMLRVQLVQISTDEYLLIAVLHHIAFDGWSLPVLVNELVEFYNSAVEKREPLLAALPVQYADYAMWQRKYLSDEILASKILYWKQQLAGVERLDLPVDYVRPASQSVRGSIAHHKPVSALHDVIQALCIQEGITLFMFLLGAFKILLQRYSGQQDICIGTPVAGRQHAETEALIGFFINTLALRATVQDDTTVSDLLQQLKQVTLGAYQHQDVPFEKVVEALGIEREPGRNPVFQVIFALQNMAEPAALNLHGVSLDAGNAGQFTSQFDLNFNITTSADGLRFSMSYCNDLFSEHTVQRMLHWYEQLLDQLSKDIHQPVGRLSLLAPGEEKKVKEHFNNTSVAYPADRSIVDVFNEQVLLFPHETALSFSNESYTYSQLDICTNQFANYLFHAGIKPGDRVPVCLDRSASLIVAILGVLKAGGIYVPVDAGYPAERIAYMLHDIDARFIITQSDMEVVLAPGIQEINIDQQWPVITEQKQVCTTAELHASSPAYIMYTSGSTGTPKGVVVTHGNVVSLVKGVNYVTLNNQTVLLSTGSPSFDATTIEYWGPLLNGGRLVLCSQEQLLDTRELKNIISNEKINMMWFTAGWFNQLAETDISLFETLQTVMAGGDRLSVQHIAMLRDKYPHLQIINGYGPTENTTFSLTCDIKEITPGKEIPVGIPLENRKAWILDENLQLCPIGMRGEICVGGAGLAQGYWKQEALTNERFIQVEGLGRLYRTGDIGRWLPDGNIEFLGRKDNQVKIRGFRVELGEIESLLQQQEGVRQAVVIATANNENNSKRLAAYIVPNEGYDKEAVMAWLQSNLPDYMIPSVVIELDELPLTPNGKVDRRRLPDSVSISSDNGTYAAPRNEMEQQLAELWQELLGIPAVGINDNFFELGGDSIITIQVVSRARRLGYELQVGDLFTFQTIAGLSGVLRQRVVIPDAIGDKEEPLTGSCGLLPIQRWFFDNEPANASHFNQSVLLNINRQATRNALEHALKILVQHHDALRFMYHRGEEGWVQEYGDIVPVIDYEDLRHEDASFLKDIIESKCEQYQQSLDIEKGIVVRVVFFETPESQAYNRLLIVVHHLAIDGVSWRILLEDLELLLSEKDVSLGRKSASYRKWYQSLSNYAAGNEIQAQEKYWKDISKHATPLPVDKVNTVPLIAGDTQYQSVKLTPQHTKQLLQEASKAYYTEINDLLLAALVKTICEWNKSNEVIIGLEGHGREALTDKSPDIARTIGWFTNLYPVLLQVEQDNEAALVKSVKEQLRSVPGKGMGYGLLKYMQQTASLQGNDPWEIVFNYLGQVDNAVSSSKWFTGAAESTGNPVSGSMAVRNKLEVTSAITGGELSIAWTFNSNQYFSTTIEQLANNYVINLQSIIEHCVLHGKSGGQHTPSDYRLGSAINWREWDLFMNEKINDVSRSSITENVYQLSGLQEGILFHSLYDKQVFSYINQFSCDLINPNLDAFAKSWDLLISRHSILRTSFHHDIFNIPVQCVQHTAKMPVEIIDLTNYKDENELQHQLELYAEADSRRPFDLKQAPLMRITLLQMQPGRFRMMWTFHHLIIDGWSIPIVIRGFLQLYESITAGRSISAVEHDRYEDYIRYIAASPKYDQEVHWRQYMEGLEQGSLMPFIAAAADRNSGIGIFKQEDLLLSEGITAQIQNYLQQNRITANTLMQGVWSQLLYHYTGNEHVVFGVTVSGRPENLANVEQRVGMYINTIPVHLVVNESQNIVTWLQQLQQQQAVAMQFQHTALSDILGWTNIQGELFDSLMVFQNYPVDEKIGSQEWKLEVENISLNEQTNFPLTIEVTSGRTTRIEFKFNAALLPETYVKIIAGHFEQALNSILTAPAEAAVSNIRILTDSELRQLKSFNNTATAYPSDKTIIQLFSEQVIRTPNAIALICNNERYTYKEIQQHAGNLAMKLISCGLQPEGLVPVITDRGYQWLVSILAIWKAGGAYVPADTTFPLERINYILNDTGAGIVICNTSLAPALRQMNVTVIDPGTIEQQDKAAIVLPVIQPSSLAYIIYTSGSTGKPKGAMIEHAGMLNHLYAKIHELGIGPGTRIAQTASATFDISVWQLFAALLRGGTTVIYSDDVILSPLTLLKSIEHDGIAIAELVPSYLASLLEENYAADLSNLTHLLVTGEPVYPALLQKWFLRYPRKRVVNAYGPTEASDDICHYHTDVTPSTGNIPIGKPIQNLHIHIINKKNSLCPVGVTGEICVSGIGVGRGYWKDNVKTQKSFVHDPFTQGRRMYRTGDRGRWLPDGNIQYLGRIDEQVKIRGYRIELGEVESMLLKAPGVNKAVVTVDADAQLNKKLIGYVVPQEGFAVAAAMDYLKQHLPLYMIPSVLQVIEHLPLTANGKIDKKKLPKPSHDGMEPTEYEAPRNEAEATMASIWQTLLGIERIGIHDSFFEMGGQSLLAMRLVTAVRQQAGKEITIRDVFRNPTIAALAALGADTVPANTRPVMQLAERPARVPLSYAQEGLWFVDRLQGSVQYHMPWVFRLQGPLNVTALEESFREIINRHEVLRTVIRDDDGVGYQLVLPGDSWKMPVVDGKHINTHNTLEEFIESQGRRPFDLSADMMLRVHLVSLSETEHTLVVVLHHIAFDGWSVSIMVQELSELYSSKVLRRLPALQPLALQYADFAVWQRNFVTGDRLSQMLLYWQQHLQDVQTLELSTDYIRPAEQSIRGDVVYTVIGKALRDKTVDFSQQHKVTLFMTLLGAFKVLLHQYTGQQDICVGTPLAGRQFQETDRIMGLFVNTLPLRSKISSDDNFRTLLQQVKHTTLGAYEHQEVPFEKIVEALGAERDMSRSPVFQVVFALQNLQGPVTLDLGNVTLSEAPVPYTAARYDIALYVTDAADGLHITLVYCSDIYNRDSMERMLMRYEQLLRHLITDASATFASLPVATPAEESQLLASGISIIEYPKHKTVVDLFEEHAVEKPNAAALQFGETVMSYGEMSTAVNKLCRHLQQKGIGEGSFVGICMENGPQSIIAIFAILKTGACYVPMDTGLPAERKNTIIKNAGIRVMLSCGQQVNTLKDEISIAVIDTEDEDIAQSAVFQCQSKAMPGSLAYLIHTSGSTGTPKGVMIRHQSIMDYLYGIDAATALYQCKSFVFLSTISTDLGNTAIYAALTGGNTLHLFSKDHAHDAQYLHDYFSRHTIDCLKIVPSHLKALTSGETMLLPEKVLVLGGEPLQPSLVEKIKHARCLIINHYGPTETTIAKLIFKIQSHVVYTDIIPIGKPFCNSRHYVLSPSQQLCPVGVPGELYIGGDGIAAGYINDDRLTSEKFVKVTIAGEELLLYKTGDRVKYLADGNIFFLSRFDNQVKVRGYRIELGEIELALQQASGVEMGVVIVNEDRQGNKRLVAYVVPAAGFSKATLTEELKASLPAWMIPSVIITLDTMPLTSNGKADRKRLPDADSIAVEAGSYEAPRNAVEEMIALVWQELLGSEQIGINDNFFELGGDSIITIQVISRLKRAGVAISVRDMFTCQTIAKLSEAMEQRSATAVEVTAEQGILSGPCGLLPIQQSYLTNNTESLSHFNQEALLAIDKSIQHLQLQQAVHELVQYHDVLRFEYSANGSEWQQFYGSRIPQVEVVSLTGIAENDLPVAITNACNTVQAGLDIQKGIIMRVVLIETPAFEQRNRLLFVIHHFAVDGVSWRILLEDFRMMLSAISKGEQALPGSKSNSYREWYHALTKYGKSRRLLEQKKYWKQLARGYVPLSIDDATISRPAIRSEMRSTAASLDAENTKHLLQHISKVYRTEINDLLLAALAKTLCDWCNCNSLTVALEGHGREMISTEVDISRTVGWFTTIYPVLLEAEPGMNMGTLIRSVKEQLRRIPDKGIGYGVLKYINGEEDLKGKDSWDIGFNYLGQLDNVVSRSNLFQGADESAGNSIGNSFIVREKLSLTGIVHEGKLYMNWNYSSAHFKDSTIEKLSENYLANLTLLITHCMNEVNGDIVYTPSDYGLSKEMSYRDLDKFLSNGDQDMEDVMSF